MAGTSSIKAGEAFVVISAKLDELRKELRTGQRELQGWGASLKGIGSLIGGVFAGFSVATALAGVKSAVTSFVESGGALADMAARTGLATDKLQTLGFAASQTGASLADIEAAARHMARNGLDVTRIEQYGQQIAAIQDPTQRAAAALETFGRSGARLIPMFQDFAALKAQSDALGPLLTDAEVKMADALGDSFNALNEALKRTSQHIAAAFGPSLKQALDGALGMLIKMNQLISETNPSGKGSWMEFGSAFLSPGGMAAFGARQAASENPLGRGGDALDKWTEFIRTDWATFTSLGEAATAPVRAVADAVDDAADATEHNNKLLTKTQAIYRALEDAERKRLALVEEFATPAERFAKKQREIVEALMQVHRLKLTGFISGGEAAAEERALNTALMRLRAQEAERLAGLIPKTKAAVPAAVAGITAGARGTFSGAAAGLLGRGGDVMARKQDVTNKHLASAVGILRRIETKPGATFT